jgi:hypothetical protein
MKVITAPMYYDRETGRESTVFLAGGISGCPNWQETLISHAKFAFGDKENLVLFNPRRENFDVTNKGQSEQQIAWEHKMLEMCGSLIFWFPKETLCPITLYELGNYTEKKKNLIIGVDPHYGRKLDVICQTTLRRPEVAVHVGFDKFLEAVGKHLKTL